MVQITVPAWVATALFGASLTTAAPVDTRPINVEKLLHQRVPMRDGIHLDTNVYHPAGAARYPAILIRTPYGKAADFPTAYSSFIQHGYAVVMQDVRGRYGSEGVFDALSQEGPDGYDTLNWIAAQPWSDGKVGMIGGSYLGIAQWQVALLNNPHLKAIFPVVSGSDDYLDRFYSPGGAMKLGHRLLWLSQNLTPAGVVKPKFGDYIGHLPLRTSDRAATSQTLPIYQTVLEHPTYDSFWKEHSVRENISRVRVPVFSVGGWYDNYVESDLEAFAALHKAGKPDDKHRIMIGPWPHNMSSPFSGVGFGNDSGAPIRAYQIAWFDHWLKGTPEEAAHYTAHYTPWAWHNVRAEVDEAPVHIFVMGVNRWRDEQEWPLARTRYTALYLASKGHANTGKGDGGLAWNFEKKAKPDQFTYDPRDPAPTMGGAVCCDPKVFPWGPMDQRPVEKRKDVLVYTSDPLKQDLEVTGPVDGLRTGAASSRAGSRAAVCFHHGAGYRFYGETDRRFSERRGAQPHRWPAQSALSPRLGQSRAGRSGRDLPFKHRRRRDQQRVFGGASHTRGNFEQQFPALRSQSEYGPDARGRDHSEESATDYLSQPDVSFARAVAGGAGIDFAGHGAVWCEEKPKQPGHGSYVSGAVAKW